MSGLSLAKILRYLSPSIIILGLYTLFDFDKVKGAVQDLPPVLTAAFVILAATIGSLIYIPYRQFFYHSIGIVLQDITRKKSENCRTRLKKKYGISSGYARKVYIQVRNFPKLKKRYSEFMEESASSIHSMYILGLSAIGFMIAALFSCNHTWPWFLIIGLSALVSAFCWDRSFEDIEIGFFDSLSEQDSRDAYDIADNVIKRKNKN